MLPGIMQEGAPMKTFRKASVLVLPVLGNEMRKDLEEGVHWEASYEAAL